MFNRCVKFGLKIPNCLGKMSENARVLFSQWWTSSAHDVNWVVMLNMAHTIRTYYAFLSTLDYKFLFSYLKVADN